MDVGSMTLKTWKAIKETESILRLALIKCVETGTRTLPDET